MIEAIMTDKELILNFISQYDRPFNAELEYSDGIEP